MRPILSAAILSIALIAPNSGLASAAAQSPDSPVAAAVVAPLPDYSEFARLALPAPVVADATIRSATAIKGEQAVGLAPGLARFYVTADITTLIRGPAGLAARMSWLVDVPTDAKGRAPKLKKARVLVFARTLPGRAADLQLVYPDGQRPWTPGADQRTRAILTAAVDPAAPPIVTGVANAFFVPGALPGEGETQIFLRTAESRPISISVQRNATGARTWTVALSEVVDAAAPPPAPDSLLWYRLACALPPELPAAAAVDDDPANAARAREDYGYVIQALGRCAFPIGR